MLNKKYHGGALYIALIVSVISSIILSLFILVAYHNQRIILHQAATKQLKFNLESGLNISHSKYFSEELNNNWITLGTEDSLRVKKLQWGAYELINVVSKNAHNSEQLCGLFGIAASNDTALIVAENGRQIGLAGDIKLTGECYLPKAGIRPSIIEGQGYINKIPIRLLHAPDEIPKVDLSLVENCNRCIYEFNPNTDSLCTGLSEDMTCDYSAKTSVLEVGSGLIRNCHWAGNIKIVSRGSLVVDSSCSMNNILIVGNKVVIKKGFNGSLHVIASDSIILEENCKLTYPSSLTIIRSKSNVSPVSGIFLGENSNVHGALVALNEKPSNNSKVFIKLNKGVEIQGLVYSSDYCHVQGKVFGTVICNRLLIKTPSSAYESHILDAEVNSRKFGALMVVPALANANQKRICSKWF